MPDQESIVASRNNNTNTSHSHSWDIPMLSMKTRILKRSTMLLVMFLIKLISGRPQTNQPPQGATGPECGQNYCEEVSNYPDKTILELLDKVKDKILPGTFDGDRQGKRSLPVKNDDTEYDLINFI